MLQDLQDGVLAVYDWQYQDTGSFASLLCRLYQKADPGNKTRIRR